MAWDFAAEIHALSNFDADLEGTTGSISGENLSLHTNQWLTDGAKEVINQLPQKLKEKCMTATGVGTDFKVDLDSLGEILYVTRKNADSGYYTKCRKIPSSDGGLATDSGNIIHYATATDPAYWVDGDTSGAATLYVKPTPTSNQTSILHHVGYPSVVYNADSIANFPDEAEYLVPLYAACKALQSTMGAMQASIIHSDQDGSYGAITSLDQGWENVRFWLENEEDTEMSQGTIAALSGELQQFVTEYQWYQGQYQMLKQDYTAGLSSLGVAKGQMAGSEAR